jgi:hypothetical protein
MPKKKSTKPRITEFERKRRADAVFRSLPEGERDKIRAELERIWRQPGCTDALGIVSRQMPGSQKR